MSHTQAASRDISGKPRIEEAEEDGIDPDACAFYRQGYADFGSEEQR
jgi:hypothetical protein